jgi:outer membrane protein
LDQVKAEVQVGSRPIADQYNQEATVAQNQLTVIQQQNKLDIDKLALIRQLQLNPLNNYSFVRPVLDTAAIHEGVPSLQTMIGTALENRSDILSQRHAIDASYYSMKMAESRRYPTLSFNAGLSGDYSDTYRHLGPDPNNPQQIIATKVGFFDQMFKENVNKFLGFNLSIPIFNNLNTSYNIQSAKVNYDNMKLDMENMRLNVIQEIRQAYNDYKNYAEQLKSTKVALISAQKAYETQKERYQVGAGTLVELSQANAQYVQAQANRQQALYRFIFQEQLIQYYMGQISANVQIKALNFNK